MKFRILLLASAAFMLAFGAARAQELLCKVNINLQNPSDEDKRNWESFSADVESYINSYNWSTNFSGERIRCSLSFSITGSDGGDYIASLYVQSSRVLDKSKEVTTMARFLDDKVQFSYVRGQALQHGVTYRPLESVLDFYANVILGLEFDSYGRLDGDEFFRNALGVALVANSSGGKGWERLFTSAGAYSRYGYAEDMTNAGARPLRSLVSHYHFDVLDLASSDEQHARSNYATFIDTLVTLKHNTSMLDRSVFFKSLLESKYAEFAELGRWFKDDLDRYYRKLEFLDPIHQTFYEQAKLKFAN
jgi:hypothetical protein